MGDSMKPQHGGEGRTSGQEASLHPASHRRRRSIERPIVFRENREKLQEALCSYTTETLDCIHTVRGLWGLIHERKGELNKIKAIKNRADKLQENLNPFEQMDRTRRQAVLREELAAVLEDTLKGLEKLGCFLDAVKKLAVTSPCVFMQEKQVVIHLPAGVSLELVQEVIQAARLICPILFTYEQEAGDSFLPELQNLEVISQQLDEYIQTVQRIYDVLKIRHVSLRMSTETAVALAEDLSEDDIRRMLSDIKQLDEIRKDQHFWTVFLFQEGTESEFIREFEERQPKMLQSLKELKQVAVQLDSMNLWARISGVVGSSVVTVGVLLIIAGLGLIPFTDGGSLALTVMGLVIIGTNRVNAAFTRATEIGVNTTQQQKAKEILENFKEDLQSIQACLDEVITQQVMKLEARPIDMAAGVQRVLLKTGAIGTTGMGKVTAKGAVALSKSARVGLVGLNALFVGLDIFIYQDSTSLAKGSETEFSKSIRAIAARAAPVVDLWQKIYNSLKSEESRDLLEEPFYPQK